MALVSDDLRRPRRRAAQLHWELVDAGEVASTLGQGVDSLQLSGQALCFDSRRKVVWLVDSVTVEGTEEASGADGY